MTERVDPIINRPSLIYLKSMHLLSDPSTREELMAIVPLRAVHKNNNNKKGPAIYHTVFSPGGIVDVGWLLIGSIYPFKIDPFKSKAQLELHRVELNSLATREVRIKESQ